MCRFVRTKGKKAQVFYSHVVSATDDVSFCLKRNHSITVRLVGHSETKDAPLSRQMRKQLDSSESTYQFLQVWAFESSLTVIRTWPMTQQERQFGKRLLQQCGDLFV